jgi:protease I
MRALIVSCDGFEDSELIEPLYQLRAKGVTVDVAAPDAKSIVGKHGRKVAVASTLTAARPEDYDLLIVPGGHAPAELRMRPDAVAIARHFLEAGKPVAAICHGPLLLIATGLLAGRRATCYRDIKQELEMAGVEYQNRQVVKDGNLITSRQPADIPAFMKAILGAIGLKS